MSRKIVFTVFLSIVILFMVATPCFAVTRSDAATDLSQCGKYLYSVKSNAFASYPDWVTLALYASSQSTSSMLSERANNIKNGALNNEDAVTDYATALLSAAMTDNPSSFGGKNFVSIIKNSQLSGGKFADSIKGTGSSLLNAHIWAVISLYAAGEDIPNKSSALSWLISKQNSDGGFCFDTSSSSSDIDITAMSLIALKIMGKDASDTYVTKALNYLKNKQLSDGGFNSDWSGNNLESTALVIEALVAYDIDPTSSSWTKGTHNPVTAMLAFQKSDGSFSHIKGGSTNLMATYHAALALYAYAKNETIFEKLHKKNYDFNDITSSYWAYDPIRTLFTAEVVNGYPDGSFKPKDPIKRQEFAKMIVLARGKSDQVSSKTGKFSDVSLSSWANPYICLAVKEGYIKGRTDTTFSPAANITGAEVITILVRALGKESQAQAAMSGTWYSGYIKVADDLDLLYPGFEANTAATRAQTCYSLEKVLIQ